MIKYILILILALSSSSYVIYEQGKEIEESEETVEKMINMYKNIYKIGHFEGCERGVLLVCRYNDCDTPIELMIEKCIDNTEDLNVDLDSVVSDDSKKER